MRGNQDIFFLANLEGNRGAKELQVQAVTSLSSEDTDDCLQCMLAAQVVIPSSVQAALGIRSNLALVGRSDAPPCQLSSILRGCQGMPRAFFSGVVSTREVHVDGGNNSVKEATCTEWMRITAFNSYLFPLVEDGEREAMSAETACKMCGAMWTADAKESELLDTAMTVLCDMHAAWQLVEVLSSMDFTVLDAKVLSDLGAIPLRVKMSSPTMDVPAATHVED